MTATIIPLGKECEAAKLMLAERAARAGQTFDERAAALETVLRLALHAQSATVKKNARRHLKTIYNVACFDFWNAPA